MTTIARYDPMYAYFTVSETEYLDVLEGLRQRFEGDYRDNVVSSKPEHLKNRDDNPNFAPETANGKNRVPVEMGLVNESGFSHKGHIDFADNTVDPNTGTMLLRGVFANPEPYKLTPGLFIRVRIPIGVEHSAVPAPDIALARIRRVDSRLLPALTTRSNTGR